MATDDDNSRETESRRILDRVSQEADSSGFSRFGREANDKSGGDAHEEHDPVDAWATKVGRRLGLVITIAMLAWLVLYVFGKV